MSDSRHPMTTEPSATCDLFDWKQPEQQTRTNQLLDAFAEFHANNPDVWMLFQRFALAVIQADRKHYSANAIFERIRWHIEIDTHGSEVKLNNNHRAYYARMFHLAYPHHEGFFRNRRLCSEGIKAHENDVQVFNSGPPTEEEAITRRLEDILNPNGQAPPQGGAKAG